ncbi:MAG TPA: DUF1440 domain-containing protein [Granulicella sp.]
MSKKHTERSLAKGLLAGFVGGLAATAAKTFAERVYPPHIHGEAEPPELLAEKITGHRLSLQQRETAAGAIHWGFGACIGAAYGAVVEYYPEASAKEGASFGLALATMTHQKALPWMGLTAAPEDQSLREKSSELGSHVIFGVVTEIVRRTVRAAL